MTGQLTQARCRHCKRLLARLYLEGASVVEVKCGGCNTLNTMTGIPVERVAVPDGLGGFRLDSVQANG